MPKSAHAGAPPADLAGVRILDFSPTIGALATSALADMGAEVIHVGRPPRGSRLEPVGRNKRSIAVDLKSDAGRDIAHELASRADVVVEGFRPGVAERLGIDAPSLRALNPSLVYCSLSGYGQDGPYARWAGHDLNYQGVAGSVAFDVERRPEMPSGPWSDRTAGFLLQIAVLRGLFAREYHGVAEDYDVALVDATATVPLDQQYGVAGVGRMPTGAMSGSSLPKTEMIRGDYCWYAMYRCADDEWISIACLEPQFWARLCHAIGRSEWIPAQFDMEQQEEMRAELAALFDTKRRDLWLAELIGADLPVAPVHRIDQVAADPHLSHRQSFVCTRLPGGQPMLQVGLPMRSHHDIDIWRSMTVVGMDTIEVLAELGRSDADIASLLATGVAESVTFPGAPDTTKGTADHG